MLSITDLKKQWLRIVSILDITGSVINGEICILLAYHAISGGKISRFGTTHEPYRQLAS